MAPDGGAEAAHGLPARLELSLERALDLRYGENPHQAAALYLLPGADPAAGPFAAGATLPGQGAELQQPPRRRRRPPAWRATCGARPASSSSTPTHAVPPRPTTSIAAWEGALAGDPVSAFGGVVAVTRPSTRPLAERLVSHVPRGRRRRPTSTRRRGRPGRDANLRLVEDPGISVPRPIAGWSCAAPAAPCW